MASISKIRHEIEVATTFISNDRQTIVELEAALADLGDVPGEVAKWRLEQSRKRAPINVLPLALNDKQREYDSIRDTIAAAHTAIAEQETKIARLKADLEEAETQAFKRSWATVCDQARVICKDLEAARVAYLEASKRLYALHQTAKPGEYFPPDVAFHYAPDFKNTLRRPAEIATGLDMATWERELAPIRQQAIAWRQSLMTQPDAPYPAD